jgi:acetate---CoA ligase (ADP-forming)
VLSSQPVPAGRRVAIVTNAGGPAILAADACEAHGLELPSLSAETIAGLRAFLPKAASVANPVDMIASATADHYQRSIELLLADPNVDSVMVIFIPPLVTAAADVAAAIKRAVAGTNKPVLATFMGAQGSLPLAPVPSYMFPESAAVALARVTHYGEWRRKFVEETACVPAPDLDQARRIVMRALEGGAGWLTPEDTAALLTTCGVRIVPTCEADTANAAATTAAGLGFPVAIKARGRDLVHKTDVGGVHLNVSSGQEVKDLFTQLQTRLGGRFEGVVVQPMIAGGVEMVVGGLNDPAFGPLVMAGTGGVFVEVMEDTVFRLAPVTAADAGEMVDELKGRVLLRGYRGAAPADEAGFRDVLVRVSLLVDGCPEIKELDINPLIVLREGAFAVDARIRVGPRASQPAGRRVTY